MTETVDSRILAELYRAGNDDAARKLFERYVDRLVAVARRRLSLHRPLKRRVDPEDIVQSAFRSFFGRLRAGQFHIEEQDDLCKLLVRITVRKALRQITYQRAAKRDPGLEAPVKQGDDDLAVRLLAHEPGPEEEVAFLDQLEHFLTGLTPEERRILEMRVQGYSNEDICRELGTYDRKIRRALERIRRLAAQEDGLAGAAPP